VRLFEQMRAEREEDVSQSFAISNPHVRPAEGRPRHMCTRERSLARIVDVPVPTITGTM
jgi:hypothetical protein